MISVITMYQNLKKLRERNGLTQNFMANLINIDRSQYGKYENEYTTIPIKHLNTLCNYFNVSIDYIFNLTTLKQYKNSQAKIDKEKSGNRIKEFRKENKMNQIKLANFLNTSFSNVSSYERSVNIISTTYIYAISKTYKISADYLLGKTDSPKYLK